LVLRLSCCSLLFMTRLMSIMLFLFTSLFYSYFFPRYLHSFPTRRSSDLPEVKEESGGVGFGRTGRQGNPARRAEERLLHPGLPRSEEHTSELQSRENLVCRLLLEKKKNKIKLMDM